MSTNVLGLFAETQGCMPTRIASIPKPTALALDDVTPESYLTSASAMLVMAWLTAITATPIFYARRLLQELLSAMLADANYRTHRALLTAKFAATVGNLGRHNGKFTMALLAAYLDSGRMWFTHESKPPISICA